MDFEALKKKLKKQQSSKKIYFNLGEDDLLKLNRLMKRLDIKQYSIVFRLLLDFADELK